MLQKKEKKNNNKKKNKIQISDETVAAKISNHNNAEPIFVESNQVFKKSRLTKVPRAILILKSTVWK